MSTGVLAKSVVSGSTLNLGNSEVGFKTIKIPPGIRKVVVLCGLPSCGKGTLAINLLGTDSPHIFSSSKAMKYYANPDEEKAMNGGRLASTNFTIDVLRKEIERFASMDSPLTIFDGWGRRLDDMSYLLRNLKNIKGVDVLVFFLEADSGELARRLQERSVNNPRHDDRELTRRVNDYFENRRDVFRAVVNSSVRYYRRDTTPLQSKDTFREFAGFIE